MRAIIPSAEINVFFTDKPLKGVEFLLSDILVSICCITYNHEDYVAEAIEGFLMQKTDFNFEVLIHDDASTDGTAEIIKKYQKRYHDIIKPVLQIENQYSKGVKINSTYNYPRAKGKYIALCEGPYVLR